MTPFNEETLNQVRNNKTQQRSKEHSRPLLANLQVARRLHRGLGGRVVQGVDHLRRRGVRGKHHRARVDKDAVLRGALEVLVAPHSAVIQAVGVVKDDTAAWLAVLDVRAVEGEDAHAEVDDCHPGAHVLRTNHLERPVLLLRLRRRRHRLQHRHCSLGALALQCPVSVRDITARVERGRTFIAGVVQRHATPTPAALLRGVGVVVQRRARALDGAVVVVLITCVVQVAALFAAAHLVLADVLPGLDQGLVDLGECDAALDVLIPALDHDLVDLVRAARRLLQAVPGIHLLRHLAVVPALVRQLSIRPDLPE
eukprot:m.93389 g.93389  ORF g.93389 m.93389 type:complete len:312 (+) comp8537_c2_seq3:95-1030(+)